MRTTQANRYALGSVIIAAVLVIAVFGVYLRRSWQSNEAKKNSPPSVPASVQRSSEGFSYTQGNGEHTLFTVHASSATTFKGAPNASSIKDAEKNVLLNVSGTVYGRKGDRNDNIRTNSCDFYRPENEKGADAKAPKTDDRGSMHGEHQQQILGRRRLHPAPRNRHLHRALEQSIHIEVDRVEARLQRPLQLE